MVYGDLQIFDIIIFLGIAVFLIYRLRNVLGKRTGFEGLKNTTETKNTKTVFKILFDAIFFIIDYRIIII